MAKFAREDLSAATAAVFTNVDSAYSQSLSQSFSEAFESLGGKLVGHYEYLRKATDFSTVMQAVHTLQPDVVYLSGYVRDSALIIMQSHKMGKELQFLGGDGWNDMMYDFAGEEIDGNYYTSHWHPMSPNPISQDLLKRFGDQQFKGARLAMAHDALMVLLDAVQRAGSTDRSAIRDALAETEAFAGATGTIRFNAQGDPMKPAVILKLENRTSSFVKAVTP